MDTSGLDGTKYAVDGAGESVPGSFFGLEASAACLSKRVEPGASVVFRFSPLGGDPGLVLETMEGGVKCALVDSQDVVGELADTVGDCEAVHGTKCEDFED